MTIGGPAAAAAALVALGTLTGCGSGAAVPAAGSTPTVTVTVTATVTPDPSDTSRAATLRLAEPSPARLPRLTLEVFDDGCGLIRSEPKPGVSYENLTWSIRDRDGFQVLQRNALGETRYRYFVGGTYTAVLEAWDGEKYATVSNEVTIRC